jgi:hypothetical protein
MRGGMISVGSSDQINVRFSAGAFGVLKSMARRGSFVIGRRARNSSEKLLSKARLPLPSRLCRLHVPRSHAVVLSSRDLSDYHFIRDGGHERTKLQPWGPRVLQSWFHDSDDCVRV